MTLPGSSFGPQAALCVTPTRVSRFIGLALIAGGGCGIGWGLHQVGNAISAGGGSMHGANLVLLSLAVFVGGWLVASIAWLARPQRRRSGLVSVDAIAVRVDGKALVNRDEIDLAARDADGKVVRVIRQGNSVAELRFADPEVAAALTEALSVPLSRPVHLVARGVDPRRLWAFWALCVVSLAFVMFEVRFSLAWPVGIATLLCGFMSLAPGRVSSTGDGLLVRRLFRSALIPFADIEYMEANGPSIALRLRGGRMLRFGLIGRGVDSTGIATALALERRLAALRDSALVTAPAVRVRVARGRDDPAAWLKRLRTLTAGSYRDAAVTAQHLWAVVRDATAEESARVGAAAALRNTLSQPQVNELRSIGESCASGRLRVALRRIVDDPRPLEEEEQDNPEWAAGFEERG